MRVLLDECLPRRLKRELVGHDARTVPEVGWASNIAVVVLIARSNSIDDLRPLAPQILEVLANAVRGRVTLLGG